MRGRGGMGVKAISPWAMGRPDHHRVVPVDLADQIMLATSTGQSIRVPVDQISFGSRSAGGRQGVQRRCGRGMSSLGRPASPIRAMTLEDRLAALAAAGQTSAMASFAATWAAHGRPDNPAGKR